MSRPDETAAAAEFDQWADAGRAESMAEGHRGVTEGAIAGWTLRSNDAVLDVGCGNGWAVRELVLRGAGKGYGVDIAPRMIDLARAQSSGDARFEFEVSAAERLPFSDGQMSHVLNVESLYYYPDPGAALVEWARVTRAGGRLAIVVDLYEESPATHAWIDALDVDVHLLSAASICAMARAAGWSHIRSEQLLDPRPLQPEADFTISKYWPSYQMYLDYRRTGALVVHAIR